MEVRENLQEIEDEGEIYESIEIYGRIIEERMISFLMRMRIDNYFSQIKISPGLYGLIFVKLLKIF